MKTKIISTPLLVFLLFLGLHFKAPLSAQPALHLGSNLDAEAGSIIQIPLTSSDFNTVSLFQAEIHISSPDVAQIIGFSFPQHNSDEDILFDGHIVSPSEFRMSYHHNDECTPNELSHDLLAVLDIQISPESCDATDLVFDENFTEIVISQNCLPVPDPALGPGVIQISDGCQYCKENTSVSILSANPNNLLEVLMDVQSDCSFSYPISYQGFDNNGNTVVTGILSETSTTIAGFTEIGEYRICYDFTNVVGSCNPTCSYTICEEYFIGCEGGIPAPTGLDGYIRPGTKYSDPATAFLSWNFPNDGYNFEVEYVNGSVGLENCCVSDFSNANTIHVTDRTSVSFESACCISWRVRAICIDGTPGEWSDIQCIAATTGNCANSPFGRASDNGGSSNRIENLTLFDQNDLRLLVSPNPSKDIVSFTTISQQNLYGQIEIIDSNGQKVKVITIDEKAEVKADISDLSPGVYFYKYKSKDKVSAPGKLVKH